MSKSVQADQSLMEMEAFQGRFAEIRQTMRGLKSYVKEVEAFTLSKFPRQRGASAPASSSNQLRQGPSMTEGGASASSAPPASTLNPVARSDPPRTLPPTALANATVCLALFRVVYEQESSELRSAILTDDSQEMLPCCKTKK